MAKQLRALKWEIYIDEGETYHIDSIDTNIEKLSAVQQALIVPKGHERCKAAVRLYPRALAVLNHMLSLVKDHGQDDFLKRNRRACGLRVEGVEDADSSEEETSEEDSSEEE